MTTLSQVQDDDEVNDADTEDNFVILSKKSKFRHHKPHTIAQR